MLYVIEDDKYIFVKCRMCGKRHAIEKEECIESANGYQLKNELSCMCGNRSSEIKDINKEDVVIDTYDQGKKIDDHEEDIVRCPMCRSAQVMAGNKGFGLGKAAIGGLVLGPVGLLGGVIGSKKVIVTCIKCGYRWEPKRK